MAYIVPSDITPMDQEQPNSRELETLVLLRKGLSDDYTVFHSVHWSRSYEKFTVFGEVDFVIVNQSGDILLIEQKNGPLDEVDGQLVKRYGDNHKNPVDQVVRSRDNIIEKFRLQYGRGVKLVIDYLVYCPDHRIKELNTAALDRDRIVDAGRQEELAACVEKILGPGHADDFMHQKVLGFFQHTFQLVPDIHTRQRRLDERFVHLSQGMVKFIENLEMSPFRLRVVGSAGCGKSLLAAHRYAHCLGEGKRPLFLCYNRSLAEALQQRLPAGGVVQSWHGYCREHLRAHGMAVDYSGKQDPGFWQGITEQMIELGLEEEQRFDCIIVDEAQEFEELWWLYLKDYCLRENGEVLWLEDSGQGVAKVVPEGIAITYRARENYRSPYKIARYINRQFPEFDFEPANGIAGLDLSEFSVASAEAQVAKVGKIVRANLKLGLQPEDITILTCSKIRESVFHGVDALGDVPLRRFTGDYDEEGNAIYSSGEMRFTSVARFRGQQSPAVILVDVDLSPGDGLEARRRLAFIGMTRASLRLDVVHVPPPG